ncbi:MAG: TIM barrel protein [candidate division NC10 bacterium]|nr:TIM barrel protein [candidate division NC10 bacterium]
MRIGTAPINWNNADLPDWRPVIPYERVLAEMREAGYEGTEYGAGFPEDPAKLRADLAAHGLALASTFCWVDLRDERRHGREFAKIMRPASLLSAMGVEELIVALQGTPERLAMAGRVPADGSAGLSEREWAAVADGLHRMAEALRPLHLRLVLHNHAGSFVETRAELDALCRQTDAHKVGLCLDAGHLAYGGAEVLETFRAHRERLHYAHVKDVDAQALARIRRERLGWLDALRRPSGGTPSPNWGGGASTSRASSRI